jgi:hypothetical protein
MWLSIVIVLLGAELNSEMERQTLIAMRQQTGEGLGLLEIGVGMHPA